MSDRNLPTHGAPTVDAAAFGVEAQPRLPLFHDDPDYYEVDLGDDDFLVGKSTELALKHSRNP